MNEHEPRARSHELMSRRDTALLTSADDERWPIGQLERALVVARVQLVDVRRGSLRQLWLVHGPIVQGPIDRNSSSGAWFCASRVSGVPAIRTAP